MANARNKTVLSVDFLVLDILYVYALLYVRTYLLKKRCLAASVVLVLLIHTAKGACPRHRLTRPLPAAQISSDGP